MSSEARRRAVKKYQTEKVEAITIRVPIGHKDYYRTAADSIGMSLTQFAVCSMDEKIDRDMIFHKDE